MRNHRPERIRLTRWSIWDLQGMKSMRHSRRQTVIQQRASGSSRTRQTQIILMYFASGFLWSLTSSKSYSAHPKFNLVSALRNFLSPIVHCLKTIHLWVSFLTISRVKVYYNSYCELIMRRKSISINFKLRTSQNN
jgi:hypothetical protein